MAYLVTSGISADNQNKLGAIFTSRQGLRQPAEQDTSSSKEMELEKLVRGEFLSLIKMAGFRIVLE